MTRIISGAAKGRRIRVPAEGVRPMSDRVRESVFSALEQHVEEWDAETVLDLYAGSGGLGLETASRGANDVTFVDRDPQVIKILQENVQAIFPGGKVVRSDAESFCARASQKYSLIFLDPPYREEDHLIANCISGLSAANALSDGALIVVERPTQAPWQWPTAADRPPGVLAPFWDRRYGGTAVYVGVWKVAK